MNDQIKARLNKLTPVIKTFAPIAIYGAIGAASSIAYLTKMGQRVLFVADKKLLRSIAEGVTSTTFVTEKYGDLILTLIPTPKQ